MRLGLLTIVLSYSSASAVAQSPASDEALLAKTRALYDAPFTRDLVSFDCAVQFEWKKHFADVLGTVPPSATLTIDRLQTIQHRVLVDRSGVVSVTPKTPDLGDVAHAAELEKTFEAMIGGGLNAWVPIARNLILPVQPTKFQFQQMDTGYKLSMNGPGVEATLLLKPDMRLTSGVSQLPQPMRFTTEFIAGPSGYLLSSMKMGSTTDAAAAGEATFAYTYQTVQGFQLPSLITVSPSTPEAWHYALSDCKARSGVIVRVPRTNR